MSDEQKELDQHLKTILERVKARITELGLESPWLNMGIMRIFNEVSVDYWTALSQQNEEPERLTMRSRPTNVPVNGLEIEAVSEEGHVMQVAFALPDEGSMFAAGHKITIGPDNEVISRHRDGSRCEVACVGCEEPKPVLVEEDNEAYVACLTCGSCTEPYDDRYLAIGAWLIGKALLAYD